MSTAESGRLVDSSETAIGDPTSTRRPRLLRRLGVLAGLGASLYCLAAWPPLHDTGFDGLAFLILLLVGTVYLAWIVLRTRDMVWDPDSLHPIDAWLCRNSGPLASGLAAALLAFAIAAIAAAEADGKEPIFLTSEAVLAILYVVFEVGFVFAMACFYVPPELNPARPILMWRVISLVLAVIYGAYVLFIPIGRLASGLGG